MRRALSMSILLYTALLAQPALAGDSSAGKKLYDANCTKCHDTSVHTRQERKIKSLDALDKQLIACAQAAQVKLSDTERGNIAEYLNEQFYKFR